MKKSTAIIGAGAIAYCHAAALTKLGVEIRAVIDVNPESADKLARQCGAAVVSDLAEVVEGLDMVHICTPPSARVAHARTAMEAGCHVLMEKPIATTLADAQILVDLARIHKVRLMVDFNHRFRSGFQELLKRVRSGDLGEVVSVFVSRMGMLGGNAGTQHDTWRRRADTVCGMSIESLSHDIDMIHQLAGPVSTVQANVRCTIADAPTFDDNASVLLGMRSGAMGNINASWSSYLKGSARGVLGTRGTAILEGGDLFDFDRLRLRTRDMSGEEVIELNDVYRFASCPSYFNVNRYFLECVEKNVASSASGHHALEVLKVSLAILDAARTQTLQGL
ncbi:Inositol 2-dehydrogenase/D-chiro-inositol 3-dehydrogenase [Castellaniella defragrans]